MQNVVPIRGFEEKKSVRAKEGRSLLGLLLIAIEAAVPRQCRACLKRLECPKKGGEEFCMDWESPSSD
ncbi:hypothetical protein [Microbulbifer epialgicus]|uniref:Uncharacterized protein n=1 Tax=Microbulbifer epialgicus TaxID=393907 RepID=A0ABV4P699_9GAMM